MNQLLQQTRDSIRLKHYSLRTEESYLYWIKKFLNFHSLRNPLHLNQTDLGRFLTQLATKWKVSASTQNQATSALLFLYRDVLQQELDWIYNVERAKRKFRIPIVFSREEVRLILAQLDGTVWIMTSLLYGSGLRLMECLRLRVKDIDFTSKQIIVRDGKGGRDRVTLLPQSVTSPLQRHPERVKLLHQSDIADDSAGSFCRTPYTANTRRLKKNGIGNTYFHHQKDQSIRFRKWFEGNTWMNLFSESSTNSSPDRWTSKTWHMPYLQA